MFIVFEGIDGSGKTTLSNRVADRLRAAGLTVAHVRDGGRFASSVTEAIRDLGRDARNARLSPRTELLLFLARDVQLFEEATRPALARADVVIADRFFYTAEALAGARGLDPAEVVPLVDAVRRDKLPDLVFLIDVDPHVARARRRIAKIVTPDRRPPSRKGLAGAGLQHRLRDRYRGLAAREPGRWIVADNREVDAEALAARLAEVVLRARREGAAAAVAAAADLRPRDGGSVADGDRPGLDPASAPAAFLAWVDRQAAREPALAAYFLAGLAGAELDERRLTLADRAPEVTAHGLRGLADATSWRLREQLASIAPRQVARSLGGLALVGHPEAERWRVELSSVAPDEIADTLAGRDDPAAWALRERLWSVAPDAVVASVRRVGGPRARALRARWLVTRGGGGALDAYEVARVAAVAVTGLDDEDAWSTRERAYHAAPVAVIDSTAGLTSEPAWRLREDHVRLAPRPVLLSLAGLDDPRAWDLREAAVDRAKEALDSIVGLDGDRAWALRERGAERWPSTTAKSLGALGATPRGQALLARLLARHPHDVSLLKHATAQRLATPAEAEAEAAA